MTNPGSRVAASRSPFVSVVIPCYNRRRLVGRAIKSVLAQTFKDWELIVVDDGSTDDTADTVSDFDDPRIRLVRQPARSGPGQARNRGIEICRGDWVAFLDSDDEWLPERIALQIRHLQAPGQEQSVAAYCLQQHHYCPTGQTRQPFKNLGEGDVFENLLAGRRPSTTSAFMVQRAALLDVQGFDEEMPSGGDIDLLLRLAEKGNLFSTVNEVLVIQHCNHGARVSNDVAARLSGFRRFDQRWGRTIQSYLGHRAYLRWRLKRFRKIRRLYWITAKEELNNGRVLSASHAWFSMLPMLPGLVMSRIRLMGSESTFLHPKRKIES